MLSESIYNGQHGGGGGETVASTIPHHSGKVGDAMCLMYMSKGLGWHVAILH